MKRYNYIILSLMMSLLGCQSNIKDLKIILNDKDLRVKSKTEKLELEALVRPGFEMAMYEMDQTSIDDNILDSLKRIYNKSLNFVVTINYNNSISQEVFHSSKGHLLYNATNYISLVNVLGDTLLPKLANVELLDEVNQKIRLTCCFDSTGVFNQGNYCLVYNEQLYLYRPIIVKYPSTILIKYLNI